MPRCVGECERGCGCVRGCGCMRGCACECVHVCACVSVCMCVHACGGCRCDVHTVCAGLSNSWQGCARCYETVN